MTSPIAPATPGVGVMFFHLPSQANENEAACAALDGAFVFAWSKSNCPKCLAIRHPNPVPIEINGKSFWQCGVLCGDCSLPMKLKAGSSKYPKHPVFYSCQRYPVCKGTHGAHPDGQPMGIPANTETRLARRGAHQVFDGWWKDEQGASAGDGYQWMRDTLKMTRDLAHIGNFTIAQCGDLINAVRQAQREKLNLVGYARRDGEFDQHERVFEEDSFNDRW